MQMMLAGIAHELRNPMGGLELYAALLREGLADQPERLGEYIVRDFLRTRRQGRR